jgi:hypothetical protein
MQMLTKQVNFYTTTVKNNPGLTPIATKSSFSENPKPDKPEVQSTRCKVHDKKSHSFNA